MKLNKRRIILYAYTKYNFGDDLFIKQLCERYKNIDFILLDKKYVKNKLEITNLKCYTQEFLVIRIINKILMILGVNIQYRLKLKEKLVARRCIASIFIGGSIFIEVDEWEYQLNALLRRTTYGIPLFVLGCNFGPYVSTDFLDRYRVVLKKCYDICFRDNFSYALFKELPNTRVESDILFAKKTIKNVVGKYIFISVIDLQHRKNLSMYNSNYIEKIAELCNYLLDKNEKVVLCSFCKYEGDEVSIQNIVRLLKSNISNLEIVCYKQNMNEILNYISESKYIISTRFHSMILALANEIPVFPIVYDLKIKNVLKDINFSGSSIDIQNIDLLDIEELYIDILRKHDESYDYSKSADRQFKTLDKWIYKKTI